MKFVDVFHRWKLFLTVIFKKKKKTACIFIVQRRKNQCDEITHCTWIQAITNKLKTNILPHKIISILLKKWSLWYICLKNPFTCAQVLYLCVSCTLWMNVPSSQLRRHICRMQLSTEIMRGCQNVKKAQLQTQNTWQYKWQKSNQIVAIISVAPLFTPSALVVCRLAVDIPE